MERRDYFMDQIEQLGRALGIILAGIFKLKRAGNPGEVFNYTEEAFRNDLKLDIKNIIEMSDDDFIERFIIEKKLADEGLESLAEIFYELGELQDPDDPDQTYLTRSLFIYEYLSDNSSTYSLAWQNRIKNIKLALGRIL